MKLELKSGIFLAFGFLAGVITACLFVQKNCPARTSPNSTPTFTATFAANRPPQTEGHRPDVVFHASNLTDTPTRKQFSSEPSTERTSHKYLFPTGIGKALIDSRPVPAVQIP